MIYKEWLLVFGHLRSWIVWIVKFLYAIIYQWTSRVYPSSIYVKQISFHITDIGGYIIQNHTQKIYIIRLRVPPGCILNEGTVPLGCILNGGVVPLGFILNGGTVPPFILFQIKIDKKWTFSYPFNAYYISSKYIFLYIFMD